MSADRGLFTDPASLSAASDSLELASLASGMQEVYPALFDYDRNLSLVGNTQLTIPWRH